MVSLWMKYKSISVPQANLIATSQSHTVEFKHLKLSNITFTDSTASLVIKLLI